MEVAALLAKEKGIVINTNLKKQGMHSDRAVVLKKIPMDMSKNMIVAAVSEFREIKSIRIQLIGMWQKTVVEFAKSSQADQLASKWSFLIRKDSVHVARAVEDHDVWALRDCYKALLFTLPVETTALFWIKLVGKLVLLIAYWKLAIDLNSAFLTEPILGGVWLSWARFDLVCCRKCGRFGYSAFECNASNVSPPEFPFSSKKPASNANHLQLARLYVKKNVPISHPAAFDGKSWAQVVFLASSSSGSSSGSGFGSGAFSLGVSDLGGGLSLLMNDNSFLNTHLASLEHSLELLHDQYKSGVFGPPPSSLSILDALVVTSFDMILDDTSHDTVVGLLLSLVGLDLGSNSSKVLTSKMGSLESKLVAFDASVGAILEKLDQLCTSSGFQASSSSQ
ncbi:hypothetical protein G9A89_013103 [Geosiphon pyriformis]|nr:hypothetical protein G9A89_013103 [Geosiphon pyriformis]